MKEKTNILLNYFYKKLKIIDDNGKNIIVNN